MFVQKAIILIALLSLTHSGFLCCSAQQEDDAQCLGWAEAGECEANPTYMWEVS